MGQHRMGEGPLHDGAGRLIDPGYATREARRYDRAAIAADPVRINEPGRTAWVKLQLAY